MGSRRKNRLVASRILGGSRLASTHITCQSTRLAATRVQVARTIRRPQFPYNPPVPPLRLALALVLAAVPLACGGASGPGSVGAVLGRDNETRALFVREAPTGDAAEKAGLRPGDEIVMIDGLYVKDMSAKDVRAKLRGEVGTRVRLTVVRGDAVRHVEITRGALGERHAAPPREERIVE